jgi:hypothetical protein
MIRFSQDIDTIDQKVIADLREFFNCTFGALQILLVITIFVPVLIVMLLPILLLILICAHKYIRCSRELKRLGNVSWR